MDNNNVCPSCMNGLNNCDCKLKRREQLPDSLDWSIYEVLFLNHAELKAVRPRIHEIVNRIPGSNTVVEVEYILLHYAGYKVG